MRPPPVCLGTALAVVLALCPGAAPAQPARPGQPPAIVIAVRPAAAPVPALSVQLLPDRHELEPGNAAIFYHRAAEMLVLSRESWQAQPRKPLAAGQRPPESPDMAFSRWASGPLKDIPRDEARNRLQAYDFVLHEVELGARQSTCDWNLDRRTEGITLRIPEIQEMRALSRLVVARARLAVLDGKTDEALHWIQTGLAMGRHVGHGAMLIQALVGIAICNVSARATEDLIQIPGAPNLYWALTALPRPFVDMSMAMDGERDMLDRYLPRLRDLEAVPWSTAQAQRAIDDMIREFPPLIGEPAYQRGAQSKMHEMGLRLAVAAMVAKVYPEARRSLLAAGRPAAEIDAMPASQVAFIYTLRAYHAIRDDFYKWMLIPYPQAALHLVKQVPMPSTPQDAENPLLTVIQMTEPAVHAGRLAQMRLDRQLDALRTIEAIRLYAASHGGKLPASLAEITEVPVPLDPATGKPFEYKLQGMATGKPLEFRIDDTRAQLMGRIPEGAPVHSSSYVIYGLRLEKAR
jgi:hypothetical protein